MLSFQVLILSYELMDEFERSDNKMLMQTCKATKIDSLE